MSTRRLRVLLVAEGATLAHVTRPLLIAQALAQTQFEALLCTSSEFRSVLEQEGQCFIPLSCQSSQQFLHAVQHGKRLFGEALLRSYIESELALFSELKPDVVIGDLRPSLGISTAKAKIPYISICNAYWSPYARRREWPVPVYTFSSALPLWLSRTLFSISTRPVLNFHAAPLQRLRRHYGLPAFRSFEEGFTYGDYTLYADVPSLVPHHTLPAHHRFIGPLSWSPKAQVPAAWCEILRHPYAYVTLGSSGAVAVLPQLLRALASQGLPALVATAGRCTPDQEYPGCYFADYLPGAEVAKHASLVVCNGGSPTVYQALAAGAPVLGICSNMDQFLCMQGVTQREAGVCLRADRVSQSSLRSGIARTLKLSTRIHAQQIAAEIADYCAPTSVIKLLGELFPAEKYVFSTQRDSAR